MILLEVVTHPDFDAQRFNTIKSSLASPTSEFIRDNEELMLAGWIFSELNESISLVVKEEQNVELFSLNRERNDVKEKFLHREQREIPLLSGFSYSLKISGDFDIYLNIEEELWAWKKVKYKCVEKDFFESMKAVLIDAKSLTQEKLVQIDLLSSSLKEEYIETMHSLVTIFDAKNIHTLHKVNQEEKLFLTNFIQEVNTPNLLKSIFESIQKSGTITLQAPFCKGVASLVLNIAFQNVNYLKFHSQDGDFYLIQFLHTVDAIYFPKYDLLFRADNSHLDMQHLRNLFEYLFLKADLKIKNTLHQENILYKGIVFNGISPYHFYYDVLPAVAYLEHQGYPLSNLKELFALNAKSYFSLNLLYDVEIQESAISSDALNKMLKNENAFVLQIGTSYRNLSKSIIETLDKRLFDTAFKKYAYTFEEEVSKIRASGLVLWIGISSQKRAWLNQNDLLVKLFENLAKRYEKITVIFDGMTESIFPIETKEKAVSDDMTIVKTLSALLEKNIFVINLIDKTSAEKLYYASFCDFFIANYSTGSLYPSRMLKKQGLTHLSNTMFEIVKDIHIHYNSYPFSKEDIIDIPDEINPRVDFVSYLLKEEPFLEKTLACLSVISTSTTMEK